MCVTEGQQRDIDTTSNSTIPSDDEVMTDNQRTARCYAHLLKVRPITVMGKLPTADDVRAVIASDFRNADELWKLKAQKNVVSRYD